MLYPEIDFLDRFAAAAKDGFKALDCAGALNCPRIHVMAGLLPMGIERETLYPTYINQLRLATQEAARQGIDVLMEPINTRDIPRFFLNGALPWNSTI